MNKPKPKNIITVNLKNIEKFKKDYKNVPEELKNDREVPTIAGILCLVHPYETTEGGIRIPAEIIMYGDIEDIDIALDNLGKALMSKLQRELGNPARPHFYKEEKFKKEELGIFRKLWRKIF